MNSAERTLIIFKPDALHRRLVGEILQRFEKKGFRLVGIKMERLDRSKLEIHYADHRGKPFFTPLLDFLSSGPVVLAVLEGPEAIGVVRRMMGKTSGLEAEPGTIRGDLGISPQCNLIHGSDSPEAARREIDLFFTPQELFGYDMPDQKWLGL